MTAQLIDGKALSLLLRNDVRQCVATLKSQGITPGLAVVLVGDNPASEVYVRNKVKACEDTGMHSVLERHGADLSQAALLARIEALNQDPTIHGILVQLPLPAHIDAQRVIEAISPAKDVDGFHVASAGALMTGMPGFWPCTPFGCMKMLESIGYSLKGKHAVVIGRSNIVGKPMALMLMQKDATVCICHAKTRDLAQFTILADILVVAAGKPNLILPQMVRRGAVVIDVGINRLPNGRLVGDVDFEGVRQKASYITPVPGGVGPMTVTMLVHNTVQSASRFAQNAVGL